MSEFNVVQSLEDKMQLASFLARQYSARFVVDDGQPKITEIGALDEIRIVLAAEYPPLIFVMSHLWTHMPLYKSAVENKQGEHIHYVMQRYGGPAFTWMPGNSFRKDANLALSAGLFGDYSTYYVAPLKSELMPRPQTMHSAFVACRRFTKVQCGGRRARYRQSQSSGPWIGAGAFELISRGTAIFANGDLEILPNAV